MDEITIKVPGPFAGVADLGLSARYPEQDPFRPLRDEVVVMAFQDRSRAGPRMDDALKAIDYVSNLIRPVIFPFLQDCAQVARLRLTDRIEMSVSTPDRMVAGLNLRWDQIVPANGEDLLCA